MKFNIISGRVLSLQCLLLALFIASSNILAADFIQAEFDSSSNYFVYYGSFDANKVLQAQYYDLIVVDVRYITPEQIYDIRDGFDDTLGTDDDVTVIGYLSIGEHDIAVPITGDGTGPVYYDTTTNSVVHENNGYASFYVDDADRNGIPDADPVWGSYYVNAGDTAWWSYNKPKADSIMYDYECDGLFLDLVDVAGPASYGLPYGWTGEGMVDYVSYLHDTYNYGTDHAYILANRGAFYFDTSVVHYNYVDTYRENIDGWMMESYWATWDWNQSKGVYNTGHPLLRDYFAPLINAQARKTDGFDVFILDYVSPTQSDYSTVMDSVVKVSEQDQGWLTAVSSILLDEMRYDVYHRHLVDKNSPTWKDTVGAVTAKWGSGDTVLVYWNAAVDQTPPVHYHIYINTGNINFASPPTYSNVTPLSGGGTFVVDGDTTDWNSISPLATGLDSAKTLKVASNNSTLYILAQGIFTNPNFYPHILIDADRDTTTGYRNGLWAVNGSEKMVENQYLYSHSGTGNDWAWQIPGITLTQYVKTDNVIEMAIPLADLGVTPGDTIRIGYMGDFSVYKIIPTYSGTMPDVVTGGVSTDYMFKIGGLNTEESYNIVVRASDSATPSHMDQNRKLIETGFLAKVGTKKEDKDVLPTELKLTTSTYPNPFNPSVTFSVNFSKTVTDNFEIKIYDITGSLVYREVVPVSGQTGFKYVWDAANSANRHLASGVYLYHISGLRTNLFANGKIVYLK